MTRKEPLLTPVSFGWKFDFPGPNQPPNGVPLPDYLPNPPNHIDDTYLELSRSTSGMRDFGVLFGAICILLVFAGLVFFAYTVFVLGEHLEVGIVLLGVIPMIASCWGCIAMLRMDLSLPRDEPIRFNRLRRKVYVYRFHMNWLHPLSKKRWGVRPEVYNWDDLYAEACSAYGPMGTGGLIEIVTLAVVKPGTHEVLERFPLARGLWAGGMYWAMIQLFMQQGPQAVPTFSHHPRDWNNEPVNFSIARRFAPKVQWPADMDLESRTAPTDVPAPVSTLAPSA